MRWVYSLPEQCTKSRRPDSRKSGDANAAYLVAMAYREFHDTFLSNGGPPIPLVRQQMMGENQPVAVFPQR